MVFGINSSPFQSQFVTLAHSEKLEIDLPMTAKTTWKSSHREDDLNSVPADDRGTTL